MTKKGVFPPFGKRPLMKLLLFYYQFSLLKEIFQIVRSPFDEGIANRVTQSFGGIVQTAFMAIGHHITENELCIFCSVPACPTGGTDSVTAGSVFVAAF